MSDQTVRYSSLRKHLPFIDDMIRKCNGKLDGRLESMKKLIQSGKATTQEKVDELDAFITRLQTKLLERSASSSGSLTNRQSRNTEQNIMQSKQNEVICISSDDEEENNNLPLHKENEFVNFNKAYSVNSNLQTATDVKPEKLGIEIIVKEVQIKNISAKNNVSVVNEVPLKTEKYTIETTVSEININLSNKQSLNNETSNVPIKTEVESDFEVGDKTDVSDAENCHKYSKPESESNKNDDTEEIIRVPPPLSAKRKRRKISSSSNDSEKEKSENDKEKRLKKRRIIRRPSSSDNEDNEGSCKSQKSERSISRRITRSLNESSSEEEFHSARSSGSNTSVSSNENIHDQRNLEAFRKLIRKISDANNSFETDAVIELIKDEVCREEFSGLKNFLKKCHDKRILGARLKSSNDNSQKILEKFVEKTLTELKAQRKQQDDISSFSDDSDSSSSYSRPVQTHECGQSCSSKNSHQSGITNRKLNKTKSRELKELKKDLVRSFIGNSVASLTPRKHKRVNYNIIDRTESEEENESVEETEEEEVMSTSSQCSLSSSSLRRRKKYDFRKRQNNKKESSSNEISSTESDDENSEDIRSRTELDSERTTPDNLQRVVNNYNSEDDEDNRTTPDLPAHEPLSENDPPASNVNIASNDVDIDTDCSSGTSVPATESIKNNVCTSSDEDDNEQNTFHFIKTKDILGCRVRIKRINIPYGKIMVYQDGNVWKITTKSKEDKEKEQTEVIHQKDLCEKNKSLESNADMTSDSSKIETPIKNQEPVVDQNESTNEDLPQINDEQSNVNENPVEKGPEIIKEEIAVRSAVMYPNEIIILDSDEEEEEANAVEQNTTKEQSNLEGPSIANESANNTPKESSDDEGSSSSSDENLMIDENFDTIQNEVGINDSNNNNKENEENPSESLPQENPEETLSKETAQSNDNQDSDIEIIEESIEQIVIDENVDIIPPPYVKQEPTNGLCSKNSPVENKKKCLSKVVQALKRQILSRKHADKRSPANKKNTTKSFQTGLIRKILNLSYVPCRGGNQFRCIESCKFHCLNEISFKYHLESRHPIDKWAGYCNICNKSFTSNIVSLLDEYNHMMKFHVEKEHQLWIESTTNNQPEVINSDPCINNEAIDRNQNVNEEDKENSVTNTNVQHVTDPEMANENNQEVEKNQNNEISLPTLTLSTPPPPESYCVQQNTLASTQNPSLSTPPPINIVQEMPEQENDAENNSLPSPEEQANDQNNSNFTAENIPSSTNAAQKQMIRVRSLPGDKLSGTNISSEMTFGDRDLMEIQNRQQNKSTESSVSSSTSTVQKRLFAIVPVINSRSGQSIGYKKVPITLTSPLLPGVSSTINSVISNPGAVANQPRNVNLNLQLVSSASTQSLVPSVSSVRTNPVNTLVPNVNSSSNIIAPPNIVPTTSHQSSINFVQHIPSTSYGQTPMMPNNIPIPNVRPTLAVAPSPKLYETPVQQNIIFHNQDNNNEVPNSTNVHGNALNLTSRDIISGRTNQTGRKIRPWITDHDEKLVDLIPKVLTEENLGRMYKCMVYDCIFCTDSEHDFIQHLFRHQITEGFNGNYECCYCCATFNDPKGLISHINMTYRECKYKCGACFYRTVSQYCIEKHNEMYKNHEHRTVIISKGHNISQEKEYKKIKLQALPLIRCPVCSCCFYTMQQLRLHVMECDKNSNFSCNKCRLPDGTTSIENHMIKCQMIFNFYCCYCKFGCMEKEHMGIHLVNQHMTKVPFYIQREDSEHISSLAALKALLIRKFSECKYTLKIRLIRTILNKIG